MVSPEPDNSWLISRRSSVNCLGSLLNCGGFKYAIAWLTDWAPPLDTAIGAPTSLNDSGLLIIVSSYAIRGKASVCVIIARLAIVLFMFI